MYNSYKWYEVVHVGHMVHNLTKSMNICTCGVVVHNFEIRNKVTQVLAFDAQLLKKVKSCARWGF